MFRGRVVVVCVGLVAVAAGGCGSRAGQDAAHSGFEPMDPSAAVFWDRQVMETGALLEQLAEEFNARGAELPLRIEQTGNYTDIFRKVTASIQARVLPAMAAAYPSMTSEYARAGAIVPLDEFLSDPEIGFAPGELDDFFPSVIESSRFAELGNRLYSFPFCKSALMLYVNKRVLAEAGIEEGPRTWDEFIEQCRTIKRKTGKFAHAVIVDCSTFTGMVYSLGGATYDGHETLFDSPEVVRAFEILETLVREELAYQASPRTFDDDYAFAEGRVAFKLGSSSGKTYIGQLFGGDMGAWEITRIPQADPQNPHTVLYGPDIVVFNTTPAHQRAAWAFAKYFTSPEVVVRWGLKSGYVPIRKSVAQNAAMQQHWEQWPSNRAAYDCLPFARTEANVAGWQEVRVLVEKAETAVLTGMQSAPEAAAELKRAADAVLKKFAEG